MKIVSHIERLAMILIMLYMTFQLACLRLGFRKFPSDPLARRLSVREERRWNEEKRRRRREELQQALKPCERKIVELEERLNELDADPHASRRDVREVEKKLEDCRKLKNLWLAELAAL